MWARTRQSRRRHLNDQHLISSGDSPNQSILKHPFGKIAVTSATQKKVRFQLSELVTNGLAMETATVTSTPQTHMPAPPAPLQTPKPVQLQVPPLSVKPVQKPKPARETAQPSQPQVPAQVSAPPRSQTVSKPVQKPSKSQPVQIPAPPRSQTVSKPVQKPSRSQPVQVPAPPRSQTVSKPVQKPSKSQPVQIPAPPRSQTVSKPVQKPSRSQVPAPPRSQTVSNAVQKPSKSQPVQVPAPPRSQTISKAVQKPSRSQPVQVPAPPQSRSTLVQKPSKPQPAPPQSHSKPVQKPSRSQPVQVPAPPQSHSKPVQKPSKAQPVQVPAPPPSKRQRQKQKRCDADDSGEYEVEAILDHRKREGCEEYEYLLKWKGYPDSDNSWQVARKMNCWQLLQKYLSANMLGGSGLKKPVLKKPKGQCGGGSGTQKKGKPTEKTYVPSQNRKKTPSISPPSRESETPTCSTLSSSQTCSDDVVRFSEKFPRTEFRFTSTGGNGDSLLPPSLPPLHESLLDSLNDDLSQESSASTESISLNESFHLNLDSSESSLWSSDDDDSEMVASQIIHPLPPPIQPPQRLNGFKHRKQMVVKPAEQLSAEAPLKNHHWPKRHTLQINGSTVYVAVNACIKQKRTLNGTAEQSWSQRQLRKRSRSVSPPAILPSFEPHQQRNTLTVVASPLPPASQSQTPVSQSQTPAPQSSISRHHLTSKLRSTTQRQRKPSESYQDQLLEWQYELNRQRNGKETIIYVENFVDMAPPPKDFTYITSNIYREGVPKPNDSENMDGLCGCVCYHLGKKCGPRAEHCCPAMAGSAFAYTAAGKIKSTAGTPIFECNSKCCCPKDCANRVVQHGRKIPLCIFRTDCRGWGVKTIEPIKANSFVAEYVGEVITSEEAERRGKKYDEDGETYLFDLDFNDDPAFTIDAAKFGNIAHFFNHSCDPNLIVYSVWIETLDQRLPQIAFFTTRNVSAGEELTFDYQMNCREDMHSNRRTGKIPCLCGSENCIGYLY